MLLYECQKCNVKIHSTCCDTQQDFPAPIEHTQYEETLKTVEWLCDYCADEVLSVCEICDRTYEAQFMHSAKMHLYCAFWFNEVEVVTDGQVIGLSALSKYKGNGNCAICKDPSGAKVKCAM